MKLWIDYFVVVYNQKSKIECDDVDSGFEFLEAYCAEGTPADHLRSSKVLNRLCSCSFVDFDCYERTVD